MLYFKRVMYWLAYRYRKMMGHAPLITGNGIYDDSLGLQAAIDGKPFLNHGKSNVTVLHVVNGRSVVNISGGIHRINYPMRLMGDICIQGDIANIPKIMVYGMSAFLACESDNPANAEVGNLHIDFENSTDGAVMASVFDGKPIPTLPPQANDTIYR